MSIISSTSYRLAQALPLSIFLLYVRFDRPIAMYEWTQPYAIASIIAIIISLIVVARAKPYSPVFAGINIYFLFGWIALLAHWEKVNRLYGELEASAMMVWVVAIVIIGNCIKPRWSLEVADAKHSLETQRLGYYAWLLCGFYGCCAGTTALLIQHSSSIFLTQIVPFTCLFLGASAIRRQSLKTSSR